MPTQKTHSSLQDDRPNIAEALQSLDPKLCFVIGLLSCAIAAYYIPSIIIALTGIWVSNLTILSLLLVNLAVLILQNLIGNRFKKILIVGAVFAVAFNIYGVVVMVHMAPHPTFRDWWMMFFFPITAYPLNAWLFLRFKVLAGLS